MTRSQWADTFGRDVHVSRFLHSIKVKETALRLAKQTRADGDHLVAQLELNCAVLASLAADALWEQLREAY
jgi:hypothetical protein